MSGFADGCFDQKCKTTKEKDSAAYKRLDMPRKESSHDRDQYQRRRSKLRVGEEHAEKLLGNIDENTHRAVTGRGWTRRSVAAVARATTKNSAAKAIRATS